MNPNPKILVTHDIFMLHKIILRTTVTSIALTSSQRVQSFALYSIVEENIFYACILKVFPSVIKEAPS